MSFYGTSENDLKLIRAKFVKLMHKAESSKKASALPLTKAYLSILTEVLDAQNYQAEQTRKKAKEKVTKPALSAVS